jgi:peptide-methionine (S)-S-oxide reductase
MAFDRANDDSPAWAGHGCGSGHARQLPAAELDNALRAESDREVAVLAGGCFWGIQAVFLHLKGVLGAISGYAGGSATDANYEAVCSGRTGHAEAVEVTYDPAQISYGEVLRSFFAIAHDPTELNRQGPDVGSQYRSAIFTADDEQTRIAAAYIRQLDQAALFAQPIMTKVTSLTRFYAAEGYHQNYALQHPENPYVAINDIPKIGKLAQLYPEYFRRP